MHPLLFKIFAVRLIYFFQSGFAYFLQLNEHFSVLRTRRAVRLCFMNLVALETFEGEIMAVAKLRHVCHGKLCAAA